ncbi:hypothetical protein A2U01_0088786, partial [Trifolium medium]|nr:hypothetical protein [Trifolium medium]
YCGGLQDPPSREV